MNIGEKFDIYEKVKDAPTDWRTELSNANRELKEKSANASNDELKTIAVTKTVQIDKDDLATLSEQLHETHPKSYQLYTFKHDGKKPIVAVFAIVPPTKNAADVNERSFIKSAEYKSFLSQIHQEKLVALCREKKSAFVSHKQTGYEFASLKRALIDAGESSKLKKFLAENKIDIHVIDDHEERGFRIVSHKHLTPQQRGLVDVNAKLSAIITSSESLHLNEK